MEHLDTKKMKRASHALATTLLLVGGGTRAATSGPASSARHEVSIGATSFLTLASLSSTKTHHTLDVAWHYTLSMGERPESVRLTAGVRVGPPGSAELPLEGYGRVALVARQGPWVPAMGPEIGVGGFTHLSRYSESPVYPRGTLGVVQERQGHVYAGLALAPLRFQLGRFTVSAAELQAATPLKDFGSAVRVQLGILHLGGTF
ncbi:hypothetical protein [Cystobacter ferrugineus]|uniref:Outer membrane protein beta-barrel domain-containing protein n=1 Tax=Cystobacter ferrugineus TaxID=83449 RepID=A0A1L9BED1_9BACT|nr:hypothetical protein [Cystobacter ferrugineus]OJH40627.1 hypothetical protein BON30_06655 [Cystobacter ferrugineus]